MDSRCFSKAFLVEFFELYRSLPCLWRLKHKDYSSRDKKQEAYQVLVDKLREVDPAANKDMVVKKIDSFRGSYRKELRKIEELKKTGDDVRYKPKLWYFDNLLFLNDQLTGKGSSIMDELSDEMAFKIEPHQYSEEHSLDDTVDEPTFINTISPATPTSSLSGMDNIVPTPAPSFQNESSKKRKMDTCNEETLKKVCVHLDKPDIFNDEFSVMGANITNKLRKLSPEIVVVAEKLITDILFEAQCGNISQFTRINFVDSRRNSNFL